MKLMKYGAAFAIALLVLVTPLLRAQVIQQVPSDAMFVLKVNNLKATSDKIAKLSQDLGLAGLAPMMADPLAALQVELKLQQGVNVGGELAVAMMNPTTPNAVLILVPVLDYKAFLTNFPDAQTAGDVSAIKMGPGGDPLFAASWGQYAALSPNKELVAKKPVAALAAPSVSAKELAQKDAILYLNFDAIRPMALPMLQQNRAQMMQEFERAFTANPQGAKFAPLVRALLNQVLNGAEEFLKDAQAASFGLSITPTGINETIMAEFAKDTYISQTFTSIKNTDAPLVDGLPSGKYLMYGGGVADPQISSKLINDMLDPIVKELVALGPEMAPPARDYLNAIKAYVGASKGQSFGMVAPSGQLGAEAILQFIMVQRGDATVMADAYAKSVKSSGDLMKALNIPGLDAAKPVYTPKAKTVAGVAFDSVVQKIDANAQDPVAIQQAQIMNIIYGPEGSVAYFGAVAPDKLLLASGVSDAVITSAIASARSNATPLADDADMKAVASQLPKQRIAAVYVNVGGMVTTGLNYSKQFGLALPLQLPPQLPPVGATIATENGTAVRMDVHIPTTLIQSLVAAGMQAYMQMQGGGAPPPGGL